MNKHGTTTINAAQGITNVQRIGVYAAVVFWVAIIGVGIQFIVGKNLPNAGVLFWSINAVVVSWSGALWYFSKQSLDERIAQYAVIGLHLFLVVKATAITDYHLENINHGALAINYVWVFLLMLLFGLLIKLGSIFHLCIAAAPLAMIWAWYFIRMQTSIENISAEYLSSISVSALVVAFIAIYTSSYMRKMEQELAEAQINLKQLGSYVLEKKLGAGGFGEVWLARHAMLARPAAIKLIKGMPYNVKERKELTERFSREAQATALLRSPHTIQLYDYGSYADGSFYYVMELLDGMDLAELVHKHGTLPEARTLYILDQICDSLAEAHDNGLIHRDIKPANIFLCHLGTQFDFVKVLDFGLVLQADPSKSTGERITEKGFVNGTPDFMAPEQAMAKDDMDHRADIYAVGCVAYCLLTGRALFEGSPMEVLTNHVKKEPAHIRELLPELSQQTAEMIMQCLKKQPNDRPANMRTLQTMIRKIPALHNWSQEQAQMYYQKHISPNMNVIPEFDDSLKQSIEIEIRN